MNNSTNLKRIINPKRPYRNHRTRNYFYRVFDNIGKQLAAVNKGLNDSGPARTYQFK